MQVNFRSAKAPSYSLVLISRLHTAVSKCYFSVLNSEIQVSFFRKLPLQNLVFLKFYSLNEEAKYEGKITLFYSFLFISIALINLLEQLKQFSLFLKKLYSKL